MQVVPFVARCHAVCYVIRHKQLSLATNRKNEHKIADDADLDFVQESRRDLLARTHRTIDERSSFAAMSDEPFIVPDAHLGLCRIEMQTGLIDQVRMNIAH